MKMNPNNINEPYQEGLKYPNVKNNKQMRNLTANIGWFL